MRVDVLARVFIIASVHKDSFIPRVLVKKEEGMTDHVFEHVHLVLYSDTCADYTRMYALTRAYYAKFTQVKTLYYTFSDAICDDYVLQNDDLLLIKGSETYVPGILDKTVKALQYVHLHFLFSGYVIRSNISTIVDFEKLFTEPAMRLRSFDYGGPSLVLDWTSPRDGLRDDSLSGLHYISGTCILMSERFLLDLVAHHAARLDTSLIDDVALGVYFKHHSAANGFKLHSFGNALDEGDKQFKLITYAMTAALLRHLVASDTILFYRNKNPDRAIDVAQMAVLLSAMQHME